MLHLIPAPLHRTALRLANRLRQLWWRVRRTTVDGCRMIALDEAGRVLLVRHSYGSGRWAPPGGGMTAGENPVAAAIREFGEELRCELVDAWLIEQVEEPLSGACNRVHVVAGRVRGTPRPDGREVIACGLFAAGALPADLVSALRAPLAGWITAAATGHRRDQAVLPASSPVPTG